MDLRIVNTCNNNCLYCLEQSLRIKEKFIKKEKIFFLLDWEKNKNNITFYWWNPLLHPDILEIVNYCKKNGYKNIWLLTNTFWLNKEFLNNLIYSWLNNIWFYFNSFNKDKHNLIVDWWIKFSELLKNIKLISETNIFFKAIIHINNLNIKLLSNDLIVLWKKYLVNNIDFVNYFPFDRPYDNKDFLEYDIKKNKDNIISLFKIIKSLNLKAKFVKFSKDFFWIFIEFYDFNNWIIKQIWKEDIKRLSWDKITFCFIEKRCNWCFLKDNCKINGL
jgi:MoaA/NifB/PqqE/SkfB family radical SAM enzyme